MKYLLTLLLFIGCSSDTYISEPEDNTSDPCLAKFNYTCSEGTYIDSSGDSLHAELHKNNLILTSVENGKTKEFIFIGEVDYNDSVMYGRNNQNANQLDSFNLSDFYIRDCNDPEPEPMPVEQITSIHRPVGVCNE